MATLACAALASIGAVAPSEPAAAQGIPGELSIVAPTAIDLGTATPGGAVSSSIGSVTVDDQRVDVLLGWSASVSATALTRSGGGATVPAGNLAYASGPATATTGDGTFTPGQATVDDAAPLDAPIEAFRVDGPTGPTTATWSPTLLLTAPTGVVAGSYIGTLTHSVA